MSPLLWVMVLVPVIAFVLFAWYWVVTPPAPPPSGNLQGPVPERPPAIKSAPAPGTPKVTAQPERLAPDKTITETFAAQPPEAGVMVAAVQTFSELGKPDGNRRRLARLVERAAAQGARIIVLPECAVPGYRSIDGNVVWASPVNADPAKHDRLPVADFAETVPGPSTEFFGPIAKKHGVYVTVPIAERGGEPGAPKWFNTLVLMGPEGKIRGHYRKLNPWPGGEALWTDPGDLGLCTVETEYGRLGLMICYDVHTVLRQLGDARCDAVLYSIAWVHDRPALWFQEHLPDRAAMADCDLICSNWSVDRPVNGKGYGYSRVISREGKVLVAAQTGTGDEIVYARLLLPPHPSAENPEKERSKGR